MTAKMTDEMRQAIAHGEPVYVEDAQTHASYVLLSKADYERLQAIIGLDQLKIAETYPLQNAVARAEGWDDPLMDDYNDYDQHKKIA